MRTLVAVATAGMLAVSGATVATVADTDSASASVAAPTASINFSACEDEALAGVGAECGFLSVPLDWAKPKGEKIQIAVSRLKAKEKRQGVMLVNPGGPGGSGLGFPSFYPQLVPGGVGFQYDWIGFDPRGVGSSRPAVSCDKNYNVGPRPVYTPASQTSTSANEAAWIKRTKNYAKACLQKNGSLIKHMRTLDTVQDMDALRAALGEKQINFYGVSYGTYLGQAYASRYPDKVRRMVLDSNVEPTYGGYGDGGLGQITGFQYIIDQYFTWIADRNATYGLGATKAAVQKSYTDTLAELTKTPVGRIGPSEFTDVFLVAGYSEDVWVPLAAAFADFRAGDPAFFTRVYEVLQTPGEDNSYAAFNTTFCSDAPYASFAKSRSDAFKLVKVGPFGTWQSFWFSGPCSFWPVKPGKLPTIDGSRVQIPILLVQATRDGATPFAGALAVRKEFPTSSLVADVGGMTHGAGLNGNACVSDTVAAYLLDGTLPTRRGGAGPDVSCDRKPLPEPSLIDRSLPQGHLGDYVGAPEPFTALLNMIPA